VVAYKITTSSPNPTFSAFRFDAGVTVTVLPLRLAMFLSTSRLNGGDRNLLSVRPEGRRSISFAAV
jgi:hypothetical protein